MGGGVQRAGGNAGGMISLVRMIENHDRAMEYDLMTRTGRTLAEYMNMGAAGKVALLSFMKYLPPDAELAKEMHPEYEEYLPWMGTLKTNALIADLYDAFVAVHTEKGKQPQLYPRPNNNKKKIGRGAIPVSKFKDWFFGRT